jgi:hypothetical protein
MADTELYLLKRQHKFWNLRTYGLVSAMFIQIREINIFGSRPCILLILYPKFLKIWEIIIYRTEIQVICFLIFPETALRCYYLTYFVKNIK